MSLVCLVVSEKKREVITTYTYKVSDGVMSDGHDKQTKGPQQPKLEQFEQQNKVTLDYYLKYKIYIHEFVLIQINY